MHTHAQTHTEWGGMDGRKWRLGGRELDLLGSLKNHRHRTVQAQGCEVQSAGSMKWAKCLGQEKIHLSWSQELRQRSLVVTIFLGKTYDERHGSASCPDSALKS